MEAFVADLIRSAEQTMWRKPAPQIYEMLSLQIRHRLPGVAVVEETVRHAAARISVGLPAT